VPRLQKILETTVADSPEYRRLTEESRRGLANFASVYGYPNIHLVGFNGNLLLSLKPDLEPGTNFLSGKLKDTGLGEVFLRSRTLLQSSLSDFEIEPNRREPAAYIAGPILKE
jgi:hypothetical protein